MKERTKEFFSAVQKHGTVVHTDHFSIKSLPATGAGEVRVVVSKKVASSAAARNLLKRRVRAIFYDSKRPVDAIVFTRKGASQLSFQAIKVEIGQALRSAGA